MDLATELLMPLEQVAEINRVAEAAEVKARAEHRKVDSNHGRLRNTGLWDAVPLAHLTDRQWDEFYPPMARLYHYLRIKSRRGKKPVRLTNKTAADELGLSRWQKCRLLRRLEQKGLVVVSWADNSTPVVAIVTRPPEGPAA
jgi:hypothetical protein